jgi:hypothetical protein
VIGPKLQTKGRGFTDAMPVVFTPDNEPYLGRNLLFHFAQIISSAMEQNDAMEPQSYGRALAKSYDKGTFSEAPCSSGALSSVPQSSTTFTCTQKRSKSDTGNRTPETRWKPIWELEGLIEEACPPSRFSQPI